MTVRQVAAIVAVVGAVIGAIVLVAMRQTASMRAPAPAAEPVAAESPRPEPEKRTAERVVVVQTAPESALSDAQWKARYERSKREMARRERREARLVEAREDAWERQRRDMYERLPESTPAAPVPALEATEPKEKPEKKKPARVLYVFTTWCPHCDRMLPVIEEMSRRRGVSVTAICADGEEAFEAWRRDNRPAFRVRQMSKEDAKREVKRFGGDYGGPVPFLAVKSGSELVYNDSGAPRPASALLDRLSDTL